MKSRVMARPVAPLPPRSSSQRRVILAVSALAVVGVVLVAVWAMLPRSPGIGPGPTGTPRVSVLPTPQTTRTATSSGTTQSPQVPGQTPDAATPGPVGQNVGLIVNWQQAASPGLGVVETVTAAAAANGRLVVVGDATEDFYPGIWSSADGRTWQAATFPDSQNSAIGMTAVTAGGPGFVAMGSDYDTGVNVAYLSSDGVSWQRVDDPDFADESVYTVDLAGTTLVAISDTGTVLTSADGLEWTPQTDATSAEIGTGLLDMASYAGTLWAFALDGTAAEDQQPIVVWHTSDGVNWTRAGTVAGSAGVLEVWATVGPAGLVALADIDQGDQFSWIAWQSADGATWQQANNAPTEVTDVVADQAGFIAVGHYNLLGGCAIDETENVGTTWTSVDGHTWRQMPDTGWLGSEIDVLGLNGRTVVGVGLDWNALYGEAGEDSGRAWVADLPDSAQDDAPLPQPTPEPTPLPEC